MFKSAVEGDIFFTDTATPPWPLLLPSASIDFDKHKPEADTDDCCLMPLSPSIKWLISVSKAYDLISL